jgi:GxxExxY protein
MSTLLHKRESYAIVGICMEVHSILGPGFLEAVYADAVEYEFKLLGIPYQREKAYEVPYKDTILTKKYYADFVVYDKIILELKAIKELRNIDSAQCINYLKVSGNKLSLLVNFGTESLQYKRLVG